MKVEKGQKWVETSNGVVWKVLWFDDWSVTLEYMGVGTCKTVRLSVLAEEFVLQPDSKPGQKWIRNKDSSVWEVIAVGYSRKGNSDLVTLKRTGSSELKDYGFAALYAYFRPYNEKCQFKVGQLWEIRWGTGRIIHVDEELEEVTLINVNRNQKYIRSFDDMNTQWKYVGESGWGTDYHFSKEEKKKMEKKESAGSVTFEYTGGTIKTILESLNLKVIGWVEPTVKMIFRKAPNLASLFGYEYFCDDAGKLWFSKKGKMTGEFEVTPAKLKELFTKAVEEGNLEVFTFGVEAGLITGGTFTAK